MAYWWVNQTPGGRRDETSDFLWAPLTDSKGRTLRQGETLAQIARGDTIFHFGAGAIQAVSTAIGPPELASEPIQDPVESARAGRIVRVQLTDLAAPIPLEVIALEVRLGQPGGPFNAMGGVKRAYLSPISQPLGIALWSRCGVSERRPETVPEDRGPAAVLATTPIPEAPPSPTAGPRTQPDPGIHKMFERYAVRAQETGSTARPGPTVSSGPTVSPALAVSPVPTASSVPTVSSGPTVSPALAVAPVAAPAVATFRKQRPARSTTRTDESSICRTALEHIVQQPPLLYRTMEREGVTRVVLDLPTGVLDVLRITAPGGDQVSATVSPALRRHLRTPIWSRVPRAISRLFVPRNGTSGGLDRATSDKALQRLVAGVQSVASSDCEDQGERLVAMLSDFRTAMLSRYD
ncbi:MAG: hypothetical protein E4H24_03335 [Thermomicrobiales bacterium]|nr:MAG: hypothetical protein E4H24_03335 [Thermomicrobiales bacterium]